MPLTASPAPAPAPAPPAPSQAQPGLRQAREVSQSFRSLLLTAAFAVSGLIFLLDTQIKLGVAVGALHVVPVLMVMPLESRRWSFVVAAACSAFIGVKLAFWPMGEAVPWMVVANRSISLFVVWVSAVLGLQVFRAKKQLRDIGSMLTVCAWSKQIKVGDEWLPFDRYLTQHLGLTLTHGMTEDVARKLMSDFQIEMTRSRATPRDQLTGEKAAK